MVEGMSVMHETIGSIHSPTHTQRKEGTKYKLLSQKSCYEFKASQGNKQNSVSK